MTSACIAFLHCCDTHSKYQAVPLHVERLGFRNNHDHSIGGPSDPISNGKLHFFIFSSINARTNPSSCFICEGNVRKLRRLNMRRNVPHLHQATISVGNKQTRLTAITPLPHCPPGNTHVPTTTAEIKAKNTKTQYRSTRQLLELLIRCALQGSH